MNKIITNSFMKDDLNSLKKEQSEISNLISFDNSLKVNDFRYIAGVDITYKNKDSQEYGVCCIVVYDLLQKKDIEVVIKEFPIDIPYIPGFLCYREYPLFKNTLSFLTIKPDVFIFDGNGRLHERECGLAVYAGYKSNIKSIGVSKNKYTADNITYNPLKGILKGSFGEVYKDEKLVGYQLISKIGSSPIYVSSGYLLNEEISKELALKCTSGFHSIPEPTRLADRYSRDYIDGKYNYSDKIHREKLKNLCISICKNRDEQNFASFIDFLNKNHFFDNLSNSEIDNIVKTGFPNKLFNDYVCIGFIYNKGVLTIGIDPKKYYNKCTNCSILMEFPLNNRSYQQAENYLLKIFDKKSNISKDWVKEANSSWNGKWAIFN